MSVTVVFFTPGGIGSINAPGVGSVRIRETLTIPNSTTAAVQEGEAVMVYNGETSGVAVAFGSTPDAAATDKTSATTAGYPVAPSQLSPTFVPKIGDKVNVKVIA